MCLFIYSDITWVLWCLKSEVTVLFVLLVQADNKENIKALHFWPFVRRIHHDVPSTGRCCLFITECGLLPRGPRLKLLHWCLNTFRLRQNGQHFTDSTLWAHFQWAVTQHQCEISKSYTFCWMKSFVFWSNFHSSKFLRIPLTIGQHWFRLWLGVK